MTWNPITLRRRVAEYEELLDAWNATCDEWREVCAKRNEMIDRLAAERNNYWRELQLMKRANHLRSKKSAATKRLNAEQRKRETTRKLEAFNACAKFASTLPGSFDRAHPKLTLYEQQVALKPIASSKLREQLTQSIAIEDARG